MTDLPFGYALDDGSLARSPISLAEFALLCQTVGFGDVDRSALTRLGGIFDENVDRFLDRWYAFTASLPHLGFFSEGLDGKPLNEYRAASRRRFRQWILDACRHPFDQSWLDYQHEIGLRHHRTKKNTTDGVESAPNVGLRYVLAQTYPFATELRDFLLELGQSPSDVEPLYQAWSKAVLLSVILWSYPYVVSGDF